MFVIVGCRIGFDGTDAGPSTDAPTITDGDGGTIRGDAATITDGDGGTITCLLGINDSTGGCNELAPANSITPDLYPPDNLTSLDIPANATARIDSDDGTVDIDGTEVRAGGMGVIAGARYDQVGSKGLFVVSALSVGAGAELSIRGTRPLIVITLGDVTINGVIDVSGGCDNGTPRCGGPGGGRAVGTSQSTSEGCAFGGSGFGVLGSGGDETGGGGGGLGTAGAKAGDGPDFVGGAAGDDLSSCSPPTLDPIGGGSAGGAGAINQDGGDGGGGAGALQITSLTRISIVGTQPSPAGIRASGAGGGGGEVSDGGGGGGSGGGVLLEAPFLILDNAIIAANGGGGGGGGTVATARGQSGPFSADQAGGGGSGNGLGGQGASVLGPATPGMGGADDTGGGGGGAGIIRFNVPNSNLTQQSAVISPNSTRGDPAVR